MTRIPDKPVRRSRSVQTRIAGRQKGLSEEFDRFTSDARDSAKGRRLKKRRHPARNHRRRHKIVFLHRWLVLVLGVTGVTLGAMLLWTLLNQSPARTRPAAPSADNRPSIDSADAVALVSRLLGAGTPAELEPVLRKGAIPADRALQLLHAVEREKGGFEEPAWFGPVDCLSAPVSIVVLPTKTGSPLLAALTPGGDGGWRIDFEALIGHCSPSIDDWIAGTASEGTVRVLGRRGFYYNGFFRDDERWACFALTHPDGESTLYAYCPRDSPQFDALRDILRRRAIATEALGAGSPDDLHAEESTSFRTTLRLRKPEHQIGRQYEISEVLSDDWVVGEASLEEIIGSRREIPE